MQGLTKRLLSQLVSFQRILWPLPTLAALRGATLSVCMYIQIRNEHASLRSAREIDIYIVDRERAGAREGETRAKGQ